ncbi:MAG: hypothetical protein HYY96_12250 [Candidatus Tectomicrobia bacterium]|nr:hypothetical protein [Candidatus Tectomicrobia bacterium]
MSSSHEQKPRTPLAEQFSWRTLTYEEHLFLKVSLVMSARESLLVESLVLRTMRGDQLVDEFRCDVERGPYGLFGFLPAGQQFAFTNIAMDARGADRVVGTYRFHRLAPGEDLGLLSVQDLKRRAEGLASPEVMSCEHRLEIR